MAKKPNIRIETFSRANEMEYSVQLESEREKEKFIKRVEQIIRSSLEYRDYIAFLKEYVDMNRCAFFNNVQNGQGSRVRIEVHHEPLTLFDIVRVVVNKHIEEGIPLNDLYIADEVLELHYKNNVGLIPLSKSLHQIIHNSNEIVIPIQLVYGDYKNFLDEYGDYLDDNILDKLERKVNETKRIDMNMLNKLVPEYVYIEVDGYTLPKKITKGEASESSSDAA